MSELNKILDTEIETAAAEEETSSFGKLAGGRRLYLKNMLVAFVVLCWVVPVLTIFIGFFNLYQHNIMIKSQNLMETEVRNLSSQIAGNINVYIRESKEISYQESLSDPYVQYKRGNILETEMYRRASVAVESKYGRDARYDLALMYFADAPEHLCPNTMPGRTAFHEDVRAEAEKIARSGSYGAEVIIRNGNLYIIRNLYTVKGKIENFGTLILGIDMTRFVDDINRRYIPNYYPIGLDMKNAISRVIFYVDNGENVVSTDIGEPDDEQSRLLQGFLSQDTHKDYNEVKVLKDRNQKYEGYLFHKEEKEYTLHTIMAVNSEEVYSDLDLLNGIVLVMLLVLIPLLMFTFYFISRHITRPINILVEYSKKVRAGDIGVQIAADRTSMPNKEFAYLITSFNKMSSKIKNLFDYAYNEQLARKDAKIMALQSQINPHFLNNTLEMMNWQARMAGDVRVSKMIEALSTLLSHSMDRSNRREISLSEEVRCADAYFYIISMRFGQRLVVEKDIDEELLQVQVPQLILQPLLENAVVHGVEKKKRGTIWLKIFHNDSEIILRIVNTGNRLVKEDEDRLERLLDGKMNIENEEGKHISLGIRNVNERIRLIYGERYGLSIKAGEGEVTEATIKIPYYIK